MKLLGIDTETGGEFSLPIGENYITELGAVLWDVELKSAVKILAELIDFEKPVAEEAAEYNGISQELVTKYGQKGADIRQTFLNLAIMMNQADFIVAQNGLNFDKPLLKATFERLEIPFPETEWLDSQHDVDYPRNCKSKSLTYLQGFHGFCYPGHRAVFDIMAMLRIFTQYDINQIITWARSPIVVVRAVTKNINWKNAAEVAIFDKQKEKIKKAGFKWNQEGLEKLWTKSLKQVIFEKEKDGYDFPYTIIPPKKADNTHGADKPVCEQAQSPMA
jgi:DNA polymerase-3 subunit epsilon